MYNYSIALKNLSDETYGINNIELKDGAFGKELADMNGNEIEDIRANLIKSHRKIVLYTIKTPIANYDRYVLIFRRAHLLNIENIKICLCTLKGGLEGLDRILELARAMDIKVVFEPRAKYNYFDFDTYEKIKTPYTGLIFNPLEYLKLDLMPFLKVLYKNKIKGDIVFLRINDGIMNTGEPTLPEEGNGEIKECTSALISRSFEGYFSFTDYMESKKGEVIKRFAKTLMRM